MELCAMNRFFSTDLTLDSKHITLNEVESNHACKVLRLNIEEPVEIINGKGVLAQAKIVDAHGKRTQVAVESIFFEEPEVRQVHLAIAPTKGNDRFEFFLEKAIEIGVNEITPLLGQNSERTKLNFERIDKMVQSAVKQSHRLYAPKINPLTKVSDFISAHPQAFIAHCADNLPRHELMQMALSFNPVLMIGPEGDFSQNELELAGKLGLKSVSLGVNRLRTETAGLVGLTLLKFRIHE
jgi:16S rRNA (uracil1498-N3)-methyltransferase